MGDIFNSENEEASLDKLQIEAITEEQLIKMATNFESKAERLSTDICDALTGGDYSKGEKAINELRDELRAGAIANLLHSKFSIVSAAEDGKEYSASLTVEQRRNYEAVVDFLNAARKTSILVNGVTTLLNLLDSGALDCSYKHNLFVFCFDFLGVNEEFRHELCNVYRDFEELASYYEHMNFDASYLAETFFEAKIPEYEKIRRSLDQKMAQTNPTAYKYLNPFDQHNVYAGLGKVKSIDGWTSEYYSMSEHIPKLNEVRIVLDELNKEIMEADKAYGRGPFGIVISGYNKLFQHISYGIRDSLSIIEKVSNGSDENPYWIMKYESNVLSTRSKYGIGNSSNPKRSGTDYYESFRKMSEKLKDIAFIRIAECTKEIRLKRGIDLA